MHSLITDLLLPYDTLLNCLQLTPNFWSITGSTTLIVSWRSQKAYKRLSTNAEVLCICIRNVDGWRCSLVWFVDVRSKKRTSNSSETTNFLHAKSRSWRPAIAMSSRFAKLHGNNSDEGGRNVDRGTAHGLVNRTREWKTVLSELAGRANTRTRRREWIYRSRKTDSSIPAFLFCIRGARLRAPCSPRENTLCRTLKSEQARALLSLKQKKAGNAICRSRECRLFRSRSLQQQFRCCVCVAQKNYHMWK